MSVIVQATPYSSATELGRRREAFGDLVVTTLDAYAPGLAGLVTRARC
jgi:hypothetical protein